MSLDERRRDVYADPDDDRVFCVDCREYVLTVYSFRVRVGRTFQGGDTFEVREGERYICAANHIADGDRPIRCKRYDPKDNTRRFNHC